MISIPLLLLAIAQVETGDATHPQGNDAAIGKHGERSRYQIIERVWRAWTDRPFVECTTKPILARYVANAELQWRMNRLTESRRNDPIWVAVAWHSGLSRAKTGRFRSLLHAKESLEYATRVKNIYDELLKKPCQTSLKQSPRKARTAK
jgi:hypothetical protein